MIISGEICEECEKCKNVFYNIFEIPLDYLFLYIIENNVRMQDILGCRCDIDFADPTDDEIKTINSHLFLMWYSLNSEVQPLSPRSPFDLLLETF